MKRAVLFSFLILLLWILPCFGRQGFVILNHVTVIDGTGAAAQPDMLVKIKNGKITGIEHAHDDHLPITAHVVNAKNKFLIPGLWDMHVHWIDSKQYLKLFLAKGVTSVRIMWGTPDHHRWQKEILENRLRGPRLLIGSPVIDGEPPTPGAFGVSNAEQAKKAVDAEKRQLTDFIKVYNRLTFEEYKAIADESNKNKKIPFVGHVPYAVPVGKASDFGQRSIEHLSGVILACSTREDEFRSNLVNAPPKDQRKIGLAQAEELLATYDKEKAKTLFHKLKDNHTWVCPTLTVLRSVAYYDKQISENDSRLQYMPSRTAGDWEDNCYYACRTEYDFRIAKKTFAKQLEIIRDMNQVGVRIIAGTDVPNPFCYPGFSLHDELALLVSAGLTPLQALQAATGNAAEFYEEDSLGTIQKGKIADLVLLDADPLQDISNTQKIAAVIFGGRIYDQEDRDDMLADVAKLAEKPSIAKVLKKTIHEKGIKAAVDEYHQLKSTKKLPQYEFGEGEFKALGSEYIDKSMFDEAIAVFKLYTEEYPRSWIAFDQLAEAYVSKGDYVSAITYYKKSLEINKKNWHATEMLQNLRLH